MSSDLAAFLVRHTPPVEERATWDWGRIPTELRINVYLTPGLPPSG